jgi:hypothetical protein
MAWCSSIKELGLLLAAQLVIQQAIEGEIRGRWHAMCIARLTARFVTPQIIGIGHTMSTSKRSDALSASLSAHVPESASATSRTGEAEAPTASALPSESDLNVKAAPFVPASAPVTPNLSLSTADEVCVIADTQTPPPPSPTYTCSAATMDQGLEACT